MREKLKVLHLASFSGNVGDLLNHEGFYSSQGFDESRYNITQLEIRDFYRRKRFFDAEFAEYVNTHDLFIVGGGNYFELWVDHSPTGTSFMMDIRDFRLIKIPVIFNALGVDPGQGASDTNISKFKMFIDFLLGRNDTLISVRNDGSFGTIVDLLGQDYAKAVLWTPDAGFNANFANISEHKRSISINIAGDMLENRFGDSLGVQKHCSLIAETVREMIENGVAKEVVFIPHIYKDYNVISEVLSFLPDAIVREKVTVAELAMGQNIERFKEYYSQSSLVMATRFHSNISGIVCGKPTVGLASYRQIFKLYDELNLKDAVVDTKNLLRVEEILSVINCVCGSQFRTAIESAAKDQRIKYELYASQLRRFIDKYI